jgi:thiamine-phosphate pyrophosphorylase
MKMKKKGSFDIYPVITEKFCKNGSSVETLKQVMDGGAKIVQLREKEYPKGRILSMAREFREITKKYNAWLIINDHLDIAVLCGADGVHLGQDDIPCRDAKMLAPNLAIGVSTHNLREALIAERDGADYINIGPIYDTKTKVNKMKPLGIKMMKEIASGISVPFTVMGGIKARHIPDLVKSGAKRIAMVTEITMADNVASRVKKLASLCK